MKHHIWLIIALVTGLLLRLFIPWSHVFTSGHVNFVGVDSYYLASQMSYYQYALTEMGGHLDFRFFYSACMVGFVWLISFGHTTINLIEHVSVFVPPVLGTLTVLMAYVIANTLFNRRVALITAFVLAILPGEFLARTYLGAIDYHCAEVFLTTGIIMCLVLLHKGLENFRERFPDYLIASYFFIPQVLILLMATLGVFAAYERIWHPGFILMIPALLLFVHKKAWVLSPLIIVAIVFADRYYFGITLSTTAEAMHGWLVFPVLLHVIIAAICIYYVRSKFALAGWLVITVALSLWQERFDYYLMVPLAIVLGFVIEKLCLAIKERVCLKTMAVGSLLSVVLFLALFVPYLFSGRFYTPSQDWYSALTWLKIVSPDDSKVLAWWDYGYWIDYIAWRAPLCTPSQGEDIVPVAKFLAYGREVSGNPYIVIDKSTAYDYDVAIEKWAGGKVYGHNFAWQLYNSDGINNYKLLYRNKTVKIFKAE